jgi:hypothetical protein
MFLVSLALVPSNSAVGATEMVKDMDPNMVKLEYQNRIGNRYLTLPMIDNGKLIRTLKGDNEKFGTFEYEKSPQFTNDENYVLIHQVLSGTVVMPDDSTRYHEVAYCNLIDTSTGCVVARETGEFCGGSFTVSGNWRNSNYPEFKLSSEQPRAIDYAAGRRQFSESPDNSFANLLACDPPSEKNSDAYRVISGSTTNDAEN